MPEAVNWIIGISAVRIAWASGDERRLMRALSLGNLQWLCHDCHAAKTGRDRGLMRDLLDGGGMMSNLPDSAQAIGSLPGA